MLTQKRLKELFYYNPVTGKFAGLFSNKSGWKTNGYLVIEIDGYKYLLHRLAWLYVYGYFHENDIDHIDRNRENNKIDNLREVGKQCNIINSGHRSDNTSGVKGVTYNILAQKWRAQIKVNGRYKFLGTYLDFNDAVFARLAAEQCLNWGGCDAQTTAYSYAKLILRERY